MTIEKEKILNKLSVAVLEMDEQETVSLAKKVIEDKINAYEAIEGGLAQGMARAGQLFEEEEYFIPELLMCSDAMYAGIEVLKPHLDADNDSRKHKVIIGVVQGDTHDIGKNLVKIMLETAGFEVIDLGRDVPPERFVEKAAEVEASIIALSTLMTTTMNGMAEVVKILEKQQIRDRYKIMVGGGPISQNFADKIGADGYSVNAADAVRLAQRLVEGVT